MKIRLEFDSYEESEDAINGWKYRVALDDVWNRCFRPAHKHGYPNQEIQDIYEKLMENEDFQRFTDYLEDQYREACEDLPN